MKNLQGIISRSVNNATMQFEKLGYLTTSIANYNTNAYKGVRFENYLLENGRLDGVVRYDHRPGALLMTKKELDIGIQGAGYIPVTLKNGETSYTRDGSFSVNKEGLLVTSSGALVGKGIKIPPNYHRLTIKKDGEIYVRPTQSGKDKLIGKIELVNFNNPESLEIQEGNTYKVTEESGEPFLVENHDYIRQGHIERSNVNIHYAVNDVLKLNASMIASTRLIKVVDEMYRQSINLKQ